MAYAVIPRKTQIDLLYEKTRDEIRNHIATSGRDQYDAFLAKYMAKIQPILTNKYAFPAAICDSMQPIDRLAMYFAIGIDIGCYNAAIYACNVAGETASFNNRSFLEKYSTFGYRATGMISPELLDGFISRKITEQDVATIDLEKACPSIMRDERNEFIRRKAQKIDIKTSTAYRCSKCGEKKTTLTEMMTRSADEPPTLFICCVSCGHRWQHNG